MNKKQPTPSAIRRLNQKWGLCHLTGPEHEDVPMRENLSDLRKADLDALVELVFGQCPAGPARLFAEGMMTLAAVLSERQRKIAQEWRDRKGSGDGSLDLPVSLP